MLTSSAYTYSHNAASFLCRQTMPTLQLPSVCVYTHTHVSSAHTYARPVLQAAMPSVS